MAEFYVYRLLDPRTDLPFYVGKGKGERAWQHQKDVEARCGRPDSRKEIKIREILCSRHDVKVEIVAEYDDEADAYEHEFELISLSPTLTNVMPGGGAVRCLTPEQAAKQAELRAKRIAERKAERERLAVARANERRLTRFAKIEGIERHSDEVSAWLSSLPPVVKPGEDPMCINGGVRRKKGRRMRDVRLWIPDDPKPGGSFGVPRKPGEKLSRAAKDTRRAHDRRLTEGT